MQALRAAAAARRGAVPFPGSLAAAWSAVGSFRQYTVPARDGPRKQPLAPHHPSLRDQIVQRSNYKKQMTHLRKEYMIELRAESERVAAARAARLVEEREAVAIRRAARVERRIVNEARAVERRKIVQELKAQKLVVAAGNREKTIQKTEAIMHNKFTSVSLESKTWCASLEEADALIHNALVNPTAPYSRTAYSSSYSKPSLVNYGGNRKNRE